jgi:hypothetical protein
MQPILEKAEDLTEYLKNLTDDDLLKERQKAAEKEVSGYTHDEWLMLRRLAKNDLFFLCYGVLGSKRLSTGLHGHLCTWLQNTDTDQFREILLPRGHFKSTVVTIGDSIRIALPDDAGTSPWPRNLGPNGRIAIAHEIEKQASKFLGNITGHFMSNPVLMGLFPECVPVPRRQIINTTQLELPRKEIWTEATFEAFNVGARSQGRHYNFLKLDDLIGDAARDSVTIMAAAKDWFDNIQAFFSTFSRDHFDLVGTRWALDDLYAHAHNAYGKQLKKYIRGVEEKNAKGERVAIFPEEFNPEKLGILRKNPKVFNAQYANNPLAGASEFDQSWKRFYEWDGQNTIRFQGGSVNLSACDIIILIDPAVIGEGGYLITANDANDNIFIIKAKRHAWKPPELVNELFLDVQRWQPRLVVIESVLFSEVFQHWIIREQSFRDIRFRIEPAKTRQKSKDSRVRGLSNFFQAGHIYFHKDQLDLIEEFDHFGATKEYHLLDALAYGPEFWRRGGAIKRAGEIAKEMVSNRDIVTGYSKYI